MKYLCPKCGRKLAPKPEWQGKKVICPKCSHKHPVPFFSGSAADPPELNDTVEAWIREQLPATRERTDLSVPEAAADSAECQDRLSDLLLRRNLALESTEDWSGLLDVELSRWQLEQKGLRQAQATALVPAAVLERNRLGSSIDGFLAAPIGVTILKVPLTTGIAILNPFRFLRCSAAVPLRLVRNLADKASVRDAIGSGYDLLRFELMQELRQVVRAATQGGAERLAHELFWPHISREVFQVDDRPDDITDGDAAILLRQLVDDAPPANRPILEHALAVVLLHVAISREVAFASGRLKCGLGYWEVASEAWARVIASEAFWDYVDQRAVVNSLPASVVVELKREIPEVLTGIVARFAKAYARNGENVASHRLLTILNRFPLPPHLQEAAAVAAVRGGYY